MKVCESGKIRHANIAAATLAAHRFAVKLNQRGIIARSLYTYRCEKCRGWHLTRQGMGTTLVLPAAPERLQRWAMGEEG